MNIWFSFALLFSQKRSETNIANFELLVVKWCALIRVFQIIIHLLEDLTGFHGALFPWNSKSILASDLPTNQ